MKQYNLSLRKLMYSLLINSFWLSLGLSLTGCLGSTGNVKEKADPVQAVLNSKDPNWQADTMKKPARRAKVKEPIYSNETGELEDLKKVCDDKSSLATGEHQDGSAKCVRYQEELASKVFEFTEYQHLPYCLAVNETGDYKPGDITPEGHAVNTKNDNISFAIDTNNKSNGAGGGMGLQQFTPTTWNGVVTNSLKSDPRFTTCLLVLSGSTPNTVSQGEQFSILNIKSRDKQSISAAKTEAEKSATHSELNPYYRDHSICAANAYVEQLLLKHPHSKNKLDLAIQGYSTQGPRSAYNHRIKQCLADFGEIDPTTVVASRPKKKQKHPTKFLNPSTVLAQGASN